MEIREVDARGKISLAVPEEDKAEETSEAPVESAENAEREAPTAE